MRFYQSVLLGTCLATLTVGTDPAAAAEAAEPPPVIEQTPPAAPAEQPKNFAAGIGVGTLGLGGEFSAKVSEWIVLRLDAGGYAFSLSRGIDGTNYSLKASMISAAAIADWHPFSNGFRLSGGPTFQNLQLNGSAIPSSGTFTINGTTYSTSQTGNLNASLTDNKIGGYFGLGYDAIHFAADRFRITFDVGGIYVGTPKISLTSQNSIPGLAANLQAEEQTVQGTLKYLSVYPVLTIGAKYSF